MTDQHDERLRHHMYETCEGIKEHAERIVALEELAIAEYKVLERTWWMYVFLFSRPAWVRKNIPHVESARLLRTRRAARLRSQCHRVHDQHWHEIHHGLLRLRAECD